MIACSKCYGYFLAFSDRLSKHWLLCLLLSLLCSGEFTGEINLAKEGIV